MKEQTLSSRVKDPQRRIHFGWESIIATGIVLFLVILPFHLVVKKFLPDPIGTYWKEILLGLLIAVWCLGCLLKRRLLLSNTPLDTAVLMYLGLLLLRFALDRFGWVGAWGLYISVMYLPFFWLVPTVLRRYPAMTMILIEIMVGIGGVIALGGLVEFLLDTPLWPSSEMVQRQGFADVYVYATDLRRVYFVFDSPTTLANTLALILPLALVLFWLGRSSWIQLAASFSATMIIACIIVTYSRGIWIATISSFLFIGLLIGLTSKKRRVIYSTIGVIIIFGLAFGGVVLSRMNTTEVVSQRIIELTPEIYWDLPTTSISQNLLQVRPDYGERSYQTWSILDPITRQTDQRVVLFEHPSQTGKKEIIYKITVPDAGALRFGIALSPEVWSPGLGDGSRFQVFVSTPDDPESGQFVFSRYINPKLNPTDRRWRNFLVDLSPWAGQTVRLSLITEQGPLGDWAFDWAGWSELQVISLPSGYFSSKEGINTVWRHVTSIWDWVGDETNRDRLAAWSTAFSYWRAAPLWGNGLGTTGVAALRTQPERAFVTESQILKALTELGVLGLLSLAYLWFQIGRVGYLAYRDAREDDYNSILILGILTSLLIVFVEGLVYQNLEVKQVNAYFWTLVGMLAFLAGSLNKDDTSSKSHYHKLEPKKLFSRLFRGSTKTNIPST